MVLWVGALLQTSVEDNTLLCGLLGCLCDCTCILDGVRNRRFTENMLASFERGNHDLTVKVCWGGYEDCLYGCIRNRSLVIRSRGSLWSNLTSAAMAWLVDIDDVLDVRIAKVIQCFEDFAALLTKADDSAADSCLWRIGWICRWRRWCRRGCFSRRLLCRLCSWLFTLLKGFRNQLDGIGRGCSTHKQTQCQRATKHLATAYI